jgi:hypothetical protein
VEGVGMGKVSRSGKGKVTNRKREKEGKKGEHCHEGIRDKRRRR